MTDTPTTRRATITARRIAAGAALVLALAACSDDGSSKGIGGVDCPAVTDGATMPDADVTCVTIDGEKIYTAGMYKTCDDGRKVYQLSMSMLKGWWISDELVFHEEPLNGPDELAACDN